MNTEVQGILESVQMLIEYLEQNGSNLDPSTQRELASFLQETMQFIDEYSKQNIPNQPSQKNNLGPSPTTDSQLLWILAGQQEEPFINYLTEFPSPETQALLSNPEELRRTIDFLNQMMPPGQPPTINGIQHSDLNSSNIWGSAYNPQTGQMKVRFQGGAEYEYDGVPENIYRAFSKGQASAKTKGSNQYGAWWPNKNPSLGAAMNQYIKAGNFPYRRTN